MQVVPGSLEKDWRQLESNPGPLSQVSLDSPVVPKISKTSHSFQPAHVGQRHEGEELCGQVVERVRVGGLPAPPRRRGQVRAAEVPRGLGHRCQGRPQ